jgi:hypothetical protein
LKALDVSSILNVSSGMSDIYGWALRQKSAIVVV